MKCVLTVLLIVICAALLNLPVAIAYDLSKFADDTYPYGKEEVEEDGDNKHRCREKGV